MATSYTELDYMIVRFKKIIIYMISKAFQGIEFFSTKRIL